jgi:hypothetical protein
MFQPPSINRAFNSRAEQEIQFNQELISNPQAFLSVVFKDDAYLDNIIQNELSSIKNNQGYELDHNTFVINSLSGLSNIARTEQRISIQGNYSTRTLKHEYKEKLSEVITKLDDLKNNNSTFESISSEDKSKLDHQLSKMDPIELKRQRYWNWGDDKVLTMGIIGNTETLYDIKEILEDSGHTKNVTITETAVIQKQIDDINIAVDGMSDEAKQAYVQKLFSETMTTELAKHGITDNIEEYMKKEMVNAPEYQMEAVEDIVQDHTSTSFETEVSKATNQLVDGTKSYANNGWCGMRGIKWWGGFSIAECKWGWDAYSYISWGLMFHNLAWATLCASTGGTLCAVIMGLLGAAVWIIKSYAGRGSDVANVCNSGRAKITFQLWPFSNGIPTCD